jgi:prevent-host-death family protein
MMELRRHPGDVVSRVTYRDEVITLERDGFPVAVLISPARLERLERAAQASQRAAPSPAT